MIRRKRQKEETELDTRVREAQERLESVRDKASHVDSLVARLRRHLAENHFGERLYEQMLMSRREP